MSSHQDVFSFVHSGRQIGGPTVVWMGLLHHGPMSPRDLLPARALLKTKELVGLFLRHGTGAAARPATSARGTFSAPRVSLVLFCSTPAGKPAVEISL